MTKLHRFNRYKFPISQHSKRTLHR